MLMVDGEVVVLFRPTVAFGGEELDIWLSGTEAHWVTSVFAGRSRVPCLRVLQTLVEAGKGESAKGETGQESGLLVLPQLVCFAVVVVVVDEVVVGQAFLCLVEYKDDLGNAPGLLPESLLAW